MNPENGASVVQLQPDDVERHAEHSSREQRRAARAVDFLADPEERG